RLAASGTARAHVHAMKAGGGAPSEGHVRGQFIAELLAADLDISYEPIVTKRGEVLHGHSKDGRLLPADLMLCDVGGGTSEGWGADLTRTWPVSGQFTVTQRTLYQLVLDIQKELISAVAPGKEYAEIHDLAHLRMTESLKALGLLRGSIDELMA